MYVAPTFNDFSFTSRDYTSLKRELDIKFPDKPDWFKHLIAGQRDVDHWYLDAVGQDSNLATSFSPQKSYDHCARLDYYPSSASPAGTKIRVTVPMSASPTVIQRSELVWTISALNSRSVVQFEALADVTIPAGSTTADVDVYEGKTFYDVFIGSGDGTTQFKTMILSIPDLLDRSTVMTCSSLPWSERETLVNSAPTDRHYRLIRMPDGLPAIEFGDGEMGAIPPMAPIYMTYRTGGGIVGNIAMAGATVSYIGGNSNVTASSMLTDAKGGGAAETMARARYLAPRMLKVKYNAVREEDFEALSLKYSTSIGQAKCFPSLYGMGTIAVHVVPAAGGTFNSSFLLGLQNYLILRSVLSKADVRVRNAELLTQNISATVTMIPGATWATVLAYCQFALKMLVSESSASVAEVYRSFGAAGGIAGAVTMINSIWGFSFIAADYPELSSIIERRIRDGLPTWGKSFSMYDVQGALNTISLVNTVNVTAPTGVSAVPFRNISTAGVFTVTQG